MSKFIATRILIKPVRYLLILLTSLPAFAATVTLNPTADAYVQAGSNANKNYGSATTLRVRTNATTNNNYDSYLKFDTASATGSITSAKLRVRAKLSASGSTTSQVQAVANTSWGETTITWNNKPALGSSLGSFTTTSTSYVWKEIDITAYVQTEKAAGRNLISLGLHSSANSSLLTTLQSRNATSNKPELLIITAAANLPPSVNLSAPANNSIYTAPASINISANATDSDGSITKVEFYNGATLLNTDTSAPYAYTWSNVAQGSYTLTAKATDNANATTTSTPINITVNAIPNAPPTVSLLAPANNDSFTAPATLSIVANASDSDGSISKVEFYNSSTLLGSATQNPYTYDWTNVAAGNYTLTAKATDNANASTTSAPINISVTAPQVAPGTYYIYADHLNTPRVITDQSNKTVWRWDSDAFGTSMPSEDPDGDGVKFGYNLRFPGQYFDKETGLHYNYFRDYDPGTGRYVQADPIGIAGGINLYQYADSNPISKKDPKGLTPETWEPGDNPGTPVLSENVRRIFTDPEFSECVAKCQQAKSAICGFITMGAASIGYIVGGIAGVPLAPASAGTSVVAGANIGGVVLGGSATLACAFGTESCFERCKKKQCSYDPSK